MLASDVLSLVFENLSLSDLASATAVCRQWREIANDSTVVDAAAANSKSLRLSRTQMMRAFGLKKFELTMLPARPHISRHGYTCWLYDSTAIAHALKRSKVQGTKAPGSRPRRARRRLVMQPYCASGDRKR